VIADHVRSLAGGAKTTTGEVDGRMKELAIAIDKLAEGGTEAAERAARVQSGSRNDLR